MTGDTITTLRDLEVFLREIMSADQVQNIRLAKNRRSSYYCWTAGDGNTAGAYPIIYWKRELMAAWERGAREWLNTQHRGFRMTPTEKVLIRCSDIKSEEE